MHSQHLEFVRALMLLLNFLNDKRFGEQGLNTFEDVIQTPEL